MLAGGSGKDHQYTPIVTVYVYSKRAKRKRANNRLFPMVRPLPLASGTTSNRESNPCALLLQELPLS